MTGPNPDMHKSRVSESCLKYDLEESLRVLGTDYIDIFFITETTKMCRSVN